MGGKRWSEQEVIYLQDNWGVLSIECIAKKLKRSKVAIYNRANKIGLGDSRLSGGRISLSQFVRATGITSYTIKEKWTKANFKFYRIKQGRFASYKIDLDFFWKWAEENKKLVSFAKWDEGTLGIEPEWVKEKRKADKLNPAYINGNRKWTKEQDLLLIQMVKLGRYTYKDLANQFKRTEAAIKRRLYDLKVQYRPISREIHKRWTKEENIKMLELHNKGYANVTIAKILDKTELTIWERIKVLGGTPQYAAMG